ncbi:MAG: type II toxin-antitoxin system VapC family toxin [Verrucomicrobiales bacterium]|nr:type II toxin-antitoxin system VapC family toxin [Verrucomicrobiales bacterium]
MMLDTNALSGWAEGDAALLLLLPKDRLWHLPVVVLGEFRFGIQRSREHRKLEAWLRDVEEACVVVNIDLGTSIQYAEIREELRRAGTPIPENDIWIAALCRQHELPIASRDEHLDKVRGLRRLGW